MRDGTLAKASGEYTFTKASEEEDLKDEMDFATSDTWKTNHEAAEAQRTAYHLPTNTTTHMKCFVYAVMDAPIDADGPYTNLLGNNWEEVNYALDGSGDDASYASLSLLTALMAFLLIQA